MCKSKNKSEQYKDYGLGAYKKVPDSEGPIMSEEKCDGEFLEEVESQWELRQSIDAFTFPRLLGLAKQGARVIAFEKRHRQFLYGYKRFTACIKTDVKCIENFLEAESQL